MKNHSLRIWSLLLALSVPAASVGSVPVLANETEMQSEEVPSSEVSLESDEAQNDQIRSLISRSDKAITLIKETVRRSPSSIRQNPRLNRKRTR